MNLKYFILGALVISVLIFGGCQTATTARTNPATSTPATSSVQSSAAVQFPLTITDDMGRSVTLKTMPKRLVSLAPSNTEIVFAVGLGSQLVGDTTYCDYPEAAKTITKVGGYSDVDTEKVVSLQPDLILASDLHLPDVVPALEQLKIPVIVLRPTTIQGILNDISLVGKVTGKSAEAASLNTDLSQKIESITLKTGQYKGPKAGVLFVTWHDPIYTAGGDTITGELIDLAGGTNVAADLSGYATMTLEAVVQKNPQIIIVMSSMGDQVSLDYINSEPRLAVIDALKNKKVFGVDADLFGRTTPRTIDALEQLARIVQPDSFK